MRLMMHVSRVIWRIGYVSDLNFLFVRWPTHFAPGIARVTLTTGDPRSCAFTQALPSQFCFTRASPSPFNLGSATVTCMEVRGVVLSTVAPGKVLKIDSYFCRRWFLAQFGVRTQWFMRSHATDVGHKHLHIAFPWVNWTGSNGIQMLLMP